MIVMLLMTCGITGAWADELSEAQALNLAQQFVASHNTRKSAPTVAAAGQVSGLYLFNVSNDGGFVIVSNDDATTPILGYGERGNIDTANMPDNMRAWLQGYADEIAWLQTQTAQSPQNKAPRNPQYQALRRESEDPEPSGWTPGNTKTDITPLLTTKWNQGAPYNDLCPTDCATGCVATAMAQVMYYTETVTHSNATTTTTAEIPGYTTRNGSYTLPAISAGSTINWSAMTTTYGSGSTVDAENAVATLMQYCGYAVKMNYGPSSGAYTYDVVTALKNYFGYAGTVTYVIRSFYTYANWTDLIYNELSQGRPVMYAGQSVGGGHEFVCDGYKYDEGDLFHINWGWGGSSDGYFVLSALNPEDQGIGGSSSNDGYHYGQEAVIGIQKTGDSGTVLNVPANVPNLTFNSISLSHSTIALGESVDITINITNNSETIDYDGDIQLTGINDGKVFVIPAKSTQNCVITVTPTSTMTGQTVRAEYYTGATTSVTSTCSATLSVKNQTPTGLTASAINETSATIGWTNVGVAAKWNLRYQPVSVTTEDFSGTTDGWTLEGWETDANAGIGGSPCVKTVVDSERDWIITPQISFGGMFSFYARKSGEAAESVSVLYSRNMHNFTYLLKDATVTTSSTKYTVDLNGLSGKGWIAIIHSSDTEGSYVYVDEVTIVEPGGNWTTVNDLNTTSYTLTGLSTAPRYEAQVQAVNNNGGKWSTPVVFTTTKNALQLADNDSEAAIADTELIDLWNGVTANATISDRTLYRDNAWNTLCLPFDVTLAGSPLEEATVMELDTETGIYSHDTGLNGTTLYLNFKAATAITAGTPYIIKWAEGNAISNPVFYGVTIDKNASTEVSFPGGKFVGTYNSQTFTSENKSILFLGDGNLLYYPQPNLSDPVNPYPTIGAFRAYFQLTDPSNPVKAFQLNFDDATRLTEVTEKTEDTEAWFDLNGRRLSGKPTAKGLYIRGGRKFVVK